MIRPHRIHYPGKSPSQAATGAGKIGDGEASIFGQSRNLDCLTPMESAEIATLHADAAMKRHLLEMGFTPGSRVTYFMKTPFGDPKIFLVRGASIALRREEARCIRLLP